MLARLFHRLARDRKGQGLVEYALIIGGVALVGAAAVSLFGHKTNQMIAAVTSILPGAHQDDNGPIAAGKLIETTSASNGPIKLDVQAVSQANGQARLGNNVIGGGNGANNDGFGGLVVDTQ